MPLRPKIALLGGSGFFGSRLAQILAIRGADITLVGRSATRANAVARDLPGVVGVLTADRNDAKSLASRVAEHLGATTREPDAGPPVLIDASGPFFVTPQCYDIPAWCKAHGLAYVDIADDRAFVRGFEQGVAHACAHIAEEHALDLSPNLITNLLSSDGSPPLITGASSVPCVSSAAVEHVINLLRSSESEDGSSHRATGPATKEVAEIDMAILPGDSAPNGLAVVRSVLAFSGAPVPIPVDNSMRLAKGWGETVRISDSSVPVRASICSVPDLDVFGAVSPPLRLPTTSPAVTVRSCTFRAGIKPQWLHASLEWLSWASAIARVSPAGLARLGSWVLGAIARSGVVRDSEGRMLVQVTLRDDEGNGKNNVTDGATPGVRVGTWEVIAGSGVGPSLPGLPAAVLAEKISEGTAPPGPRSAAFLLSLHELYPFYKALSVEQKTHLDVDPKRPPIPRISTQSYLPRARDVSPLFAALDRADSESLPPCVQAVHTGQVAGPRFGQARIGGRARVSFAADGFFGSIAAVGCHFLRLFASLPQPSDHDVRLAFTRAPARGCSDDTHVETWTRQFGDHMFRTTLQLRPGENVFEEIVGPLAIAFRPEVRRDDETIGKMSLHWVPVAARISFLRRSLPIRVPLFLCPQIEAHEFADELDSYAFMVKITFPLIGLVAQYDGGLKN